MSFLDNNSARRMENGSNDMEDVKKPPNHQHQTAQVGVSVGEQAVISTGSSPYYMQTAKGNYVPAMPPPSTTMFQMQSLAPNASFNQSMNPTNQEMAAVVPSAIQKEPKITDCSVITGESRTIDCSVILGVTTLM